ISLVFHCHEPSWRETEDRSAVRQNRGLAMPSSIDLANETAPFDASDPKYAALLKNLQGNILKSHGRHFSVHTFFKFGTNVEAAKTAIKTLRQQGFILSGAEQAAQTERFKHPNAVQEVF